MRRTDREITDFQEKLALLGRCQVARVALNQSGAPYIVPMNYGFAVQNEAVTLYFHCASQGEKLNLLLKDPRAGFEVDRVIEIISAGLGCGWTTRYESVVGTGTLRIAETDEERVQGLTAILANHGAEGIPAFDAAMLKQTTVLALDVESFTAKRNA